MTIQNAKQKVKKAIKLAEFARNHNLTVRNYAAMAFYDARPKLSHEDRDKFTKWFNDLDL